MNVNYSTTRDKNLERLTDEKLANQWKSIDWKKVKKEVNKLQIRIAKAKQNKKYNNAKKLEYLLTHSFCAKALAVRNVTTNRNNGISVADKELWCKPSSKMKAILNLNDKKYKANTLRKVFIINKKNNAKKFFNIPTMYDRAMQELYALAIEPVAEVKSNESTFDLIKSSGTQDICKAICSTLSKKSSPNWIFIGKIILGNDKISQKWVMENIPINKSILKKFIRYGFGFKEELFYTDKGIKQCSTISPILANIVINRIEEELEKYFLVNDEENKDIEINNVHKVSFIKYEDNFIVATYDKEIAKQVVENIKNFLEIRGLQLSEENNCIMHIKEGFDFWGWTFRRFDKRLVVKPSKKAIKVFVSGLSNTILDAGKSWKQQILIERLNFQIRKWTYYYQSTVTRNTFSHIDYVLYNLLYRWAKRRHPTKAHKWIISKYWRNVGLSKWVFATEKIALLRINKNMYKK